MKKTIILLLSVLTFTACQKEKQSEKALAPRVETAQVETIQTAGTLHYSGTIEASQTIPLTFQTSGIVQQVLVSVGDAVHKGQLLAVIDKSDNQNMYEVALAKYQQAKDAYNRLKEVHEQGSLAEIKWVEMESNLQQAQSSVNIAMNNLKKCNLYSPDNGIIGEKNIEPGMNSISLSGTPLELIKIQTVFVKISVPENEISQIKKGLKAKFKVAALNNQTFEGEVCNVGIVADQISRTYEVKIKVKNLEQVLKPGMVCDVELDVKTIHSITAVDYRAISKDKDNNCFVYIVNTNTKTVKKRIIQVADYVNNKIEIVSGVETGEIVITEGKQKLFDNSKISL